MLVEPIKEKIMATQALVTPYVLTDEGVRQLAEMSEGSGAPISSPGFTTRLLTGEAARDRLSALEKLVRAHDAK